MTKAAKWVCIQQRPRSALATHGAHREDTDQTGRMPRLSWVFAGHTATLLVLSWAGHCLFSSALFFSSKGEMLSSTASLFIDWLELLDPEIIKSVPDLQEKLAFARQSVTTETRRDVDNCRSQPYLLALLTHQSSWTTLHSCIDRVLGDRTGKWYVVSPDLVKYMYFNYSGFY